MRRMNTGVGVGVWAATVVAAFAVGRFAARPEAASAPGDLGAALRAALGDGDLLERFGRTANLLEFLDPETLPEVVAVYDPLLSVVGQSDIRPFVAAWARFDPEAALDHTRAWPYRIKQEIGVQTAIEAWAQRDPTAARLAYERISAEQPDLREPLLLGLLAGWVHSGGEGLDAYLAGLPPVFADTGVGIVVGALMRKGSTEATLEWADAILGNEATDAKLKRSTFRRATRSVARAHPERAAAWALSHAASGYADDGPRIVAEQWGGQDGMAALQWIRGLAPGKPRDQAVREAFAQWSKADPAGAQAWLATESLTEFHDPALDFHAKRLAARAPAEAVGWCERLVDPSRRRACLRNAATRWYRLDAVAAEAWLEQSPLDEETRLAVRNAPAARKRAGGAARPRAARR
jgi:hypothetical protein